MCGIVPEDRLSTRTVNVEPDGAERGSVKTPVNALSLGPRVQAIGAFTERATGPSAGAAPRVTVVRRLTGTTAARTRTNFN